MKEQSKILKWIIINSCNSIIYGAIAFLIGKQNNNLLFQFWGLLPYFILAIISIKFEIFYRSHVFQNRSHRLLYWICLVLQFFLGAIPSFNVCYSHPTIYALMIIGQVIITAVIIQLWELISTRVVFISNNNIHGCLKLSDEIKENTETLLDNRNCYKKNEIIAAMWMGFGTIVVVFLYTIIPLLFSINHFYNNRITVIALVSYLLFMYFNHRKNGIIYAKTNATKFDIIEDVPILLGLCLSYYYSALISNGPGSINFIVLILSGISLYPFLYNNRKFAVAYYKRRKI